MRLSRIDMDQDNKSNNKFRRNIRVGLVMTIVITLLLVTGIIPVFAQTVGPTNPNANVTTAYNILHSNQTTSTTNNQILTVKTDLSSYNQGDTIIITGKVSQPDPNTAVTFRIFNVHQNMISVSQLLPSSDGSFTKTLLITGPLWQDAGTYTIVTQYGKYTNTNATFYYNGGNGQTTITQPVPTQPPISTPLPPSHTNPYIRCTNCINAGNNQSLPQPTQSISTPSTTPAQIPNWVKGVFNFYAEGKLSDDDLIKALQFLIHQGIIKV